MTVIYDPKKTNEAKIHKLIADAGYDTDQVAAGEKEYRDLPKCCQYSNKRSR
jgi:hypothetical protein